MRTFIIFFFFLHLSTCFSQSIGYDYCADNNENDTLNKTDENNMKQGYWIIYAKDSLESGVTKNGLDEEGFYINDLKNGVWIKYFSDGKTIKLKGEYLEGKPNGYYSKFYENGSIKEEGFFRNTNYFGLHTCYFENGNCKESSTYNDAGIQIDTVYYFYPSSEIQKIKIIDTLNKIQTEKNYDKEGSLSKTSIYVYENQSTFSLLQTITEFPSKTENNLFGTYHFKLTFDGTPIFREYLLIIHQDSTFEVTKYTYESCYNYIEKFTGNWSINKDVISFGEESSIPSKLKINSETLISDPIKEIDGKLRSYSFKKVKP